LFCEETAGSGERVNVYESGKFSQLNKIHRKIFFFGTPRVRAFLGNPREYSIDDAPMYICEKPFFDVFFEPLAAVRCRSAEAETPTSKLSLDCRFFIPRR